MVELLGCALNPLVLPHLGRLVVTPPPPPGGRRAPPLQGCSPAQGWVDGPVGSLSSSLRARAGPFSLRASVSLGPSGYQRPLLLPSLALFP